MALVQAQDSIFIEVSSPIQNIEILYEPDTTVLMAIAL